MTPETLQAENAELKRKLAEAEQWRKTHEVCHDKWDGLQSRLAEAEALVQRICREAGVVLFDDGEVRNHRAEAAERERDGYAKHLEETGKRWVAAVEAWQRKCAELSEALLYVHPMPPNHAPRTIIPCLACAALASQPAPEGKPCRCGRPDYPGIIHRTDSGCIADPTWKR
jgi:hypothetical protein